VRNHGTDGIDAGQTQFEPEAVHMKRILLLIFILLFLLLLFGAVETLAQEKSYILVRGSDLNSGVVMVDIVNTGKAYQLQCNLGAPGCAVLKNGKYQMVELPNNFGIYECKDVEVYPEDAINSDKDKKLGEYCLIEK
jgi:hypothetical protein